MKAYDFGPQHPLKPERLERTMRLLTALGQCDPIDPGEGEVADVLRVHDSAYVNAIRTCTAGYDMGIGSLDNPPFVGMYEASLAYCAGSAAAARAVVAGAPLAYGIAGGLHHAMPTRASGFCVFNDPAIAVHILLEKFERLAYVDIDVHHGDGVQWMWYDDPRVLTCSIHEDPRTLWPGTGGAEETGAEFTALNVPLEAHTTGDVWQWAFLQSVIPALERFRPGAIVLQMGTDSHFRDPLAHLRNTAQEFVAAVAAVKELGLPIVALGGGGYSLTTVPRMWVAACLTLAGVSFDDAIPEPLASELGMPNFFDATPPGPAGTGRRYAEAVVEFVRSHHLKRVRS